MTSDGRRPDLASIEAIGPAPDDDGPEDELDRVNRVGFAAAASAGTPPAVGVAAEETDDPPDSRTQDSEP